MLHNSSFTPHTSEEASELGYYLPLSFKTKSEHLAGLADEPAIEGIRELHEALTSEYGSRDGDGAALLDFGMREILQS